MRTLYNAYQDLQPALLWDATEKEQQKAAGAEIPGWIFLKLQHDCNKDRNSVSAPCLPNKWEA